MMSLPWLDEAARRLPPAFAAEATEDAWRLLSGFYGPLHAAGEASPVQLYLGARSGLEPVAALLRRPGARVVTVEAQPQRRAALDAVLRGLPGGRVVASLNEALALIGPRRIGFVRSDVDATGAALLAALAPQGVDHLCGVYAPDRIDPLALFRTSRDSVARSFFWREAGSTGWFGSDAGPVEVEVSVVVPAYGVAGEIDRCLETLAAQTLARLEVIVVDDGSPDDSGARAAAWAARHPGRIRVMHQANAGCAAARMAGLAAARGQYVGFVDGDDWVDPRMFEELYRAAVLRGAEVAQCGYAEAYADGSRVAFSDAFGGNGPGGQTGLVGNPRDLLVVRPTIWRRIYRRDFLLANDIRFPAHLRRFDDLPFQFEAFAKARRVVVLPDAWYFYRLGRPGQDVMARDERLFIHFEIFDWLHDRLGNWADAAVERQLFRVELATHLWALGRIEPAHRVEYRRRVRRQLLARRAHLRLSECLAIAARAGRGALRLTVDALVAGRRA